MLDRLSRFFEDLVPRSASDDHSDRPDATVAAAALMFHVMDADGVREKAERDQLRTLLSDRYGLSGPDLDNVLSRGEEAEREAVDLYAFTSILKRELTEEGRLELIEILWEMVYADGSWHELEDNLVWRVSELLGVSNRDRVLLRRTVAERRGVPILSDPSG